MYIVVTQNIVYMYIRNTLYKRVAWGGSGGLDESPYSTEKDCVLDRCNKWRASFKMLVKNLNLHA